MNFKQVGTDTHIASTAGMTYTIQRGMFGLVVLGSPDGIECIKLGIFKEFADAVAAAEQHHAAWSH